MCEIERILERLDLTLRAVPSAPPGFKYHEIAEHSHSHRHRASPDLQARLRILHAHR